MGTLTISEQARDFVRKNFKRPDWTLGSITAHDAEFLCEMLMRERPAKCIEIGVASGVSTVFLSSCLSSINKDAHLDSFDALNHFYANDQIACGAFITEVFGAVPSNVSLHLGVNSVNISSILKDDGYDFCFIDGNHNNPWASIDLLSIIRIMKPNSWVALHDVNLPYLSYQNKTFPVYGPNYLFHIWQGDVLSHSGPRANIGAINLRPDMDSNIIDAIKCFAMPWTGKAVAPHQFARAKRAARLSGDEWDRIFDKFSQETAPDTAREGHVVVVNSNPSTKVSDLPWRQAMRLHANKPSQAPLRVDVSAIGAMSSDFLICPTVARNADGPKVNVALEIRDADGQIVDRRDLDFMDSKNPVPVALRARGPCSLSIQVTADQDDVEGAWVDFAQMYFK